jgi:hypothetical protein
VQVADLAKRIQRRKNRSAAKASTLLVVMLVPVAMIVGTVEHVLLAITVAGSFFGFRAVFGEGYLAARDDAYQVWSGIGSDVSEVAILVAVATWLRGRNCHISGCWRLSWHPHPDHGHPVCRRHHPDGGSVPA